MPMIDFTYPEGTLGPRAAGEAVDRMSAALLRWEGAPDGDRARAMAWSFAHEVPAHSVRVGGQEIDRPIYRVLVTVPKGTLLHGPGPVALQSRRGLIREVTEVVLEAEGTAWSAEDAARVYCLIQEIEDGYWGGMGEAFRMQDIAAMASPELGDTPLAAQGRETIDALVASRGALAAGA